MWLEKEQPIESQTNARRYGKNSSVITKSQHLRERRALQSPWIKFQYHARNPIITCQIGCPLALPLNILSEAQLHTSQAPDILLFVPSLTSTHTLSFVFWMPSPHLILFSILYLQILDTNTVISPYLVIYFFLKPRSTEKANVYMSIMLDPPL